MQIPEQELNELESIINKVGAGAKDEAAKAAWDLSHRENVSQEAMSLATDTALAIEGGQSGESLKSELMGKLNQLRSNSQS
jgi:hypothetical protein